MSLAFLLAATPLASWAADTPYRKPPAAIQAVLDAPALPALAGNADRDVIALLSPLGYPSIADLARPMLRLAGLRIDPQTNGIHHAAAFSAMTIVRASSGASARVTLPANAHAGNVRFAHDGAHFAFTNTTPTGTELWVGEVATATAHRVPGVRLNAIFGTPFAWMPGSTSLVVRMIPARPAPPQAPDVPTGPVVQETIGAAPVTTFEDLLANPHDEAQFEYYAASQIALVDLSHGANITPIGKPAIFTAVVPSPSGAYLLVERVHRPFSYVLRWDAFPSVSEVWDRSGRSVYTIADLPLQDRVPIGGVPVGPREIDWRPTDQATLTWVEALDGGDPKRAAPARDELRSIAAPFTSPPVDIVAIETRFAGLTWIDGGRAFVADYNRDTRIKRTFLLDPAATPATLKLWYSLREGDRFNDPGQPITHSAPNGEFVALASGDDVFLHGDGLSAQGRRPFMDRMRLATFEKTRLFLSEATPIESVLSFVNGSPSSVLTQRSQRDAPPNYYVRDLGSGAARALTHIADPAPIVQRIGRRFVTYARPDGVKLSFTLYLPPEYKEGTRLPTFLWAYPLEFNDTSVAGQASDPTAGFFSLRGTSPIFMALAGYAVLMDASIPIVGDPKTVNDTYVDQLVAGAKAAIDKAVELGVTDPNRVAVGGHSYGAFMTANLLAHSSLFRAGIARSGAYNRTLTPFGFQSERRTYWEATDTYTKMSPFTYANNIKDPLLLIHGMADDNPGTFPIQSERFFQAIRGNGGTARFVYLPCEAHGYLGRQSIETTLAEMTDWLDRFVKNVAPR